MFLIEINLYVLIPTIHINNSENSQRLLIALIQHIDRLQYNNCERMQMI